MKKSQFIGPRFRQWLFQGYGLGIVISIALHIVIISLLNKNWASENETRIMPPRSIKASVVEVAAPPPGQLPRRAVDDSAARKKAQELARKQQQQKAARAKAEEQRRKAIALKKQQAEEKARQEKDRKEKEEAVRKEKERQRLKAEEQRRKDQEAEAQRLRQLERQQQAQRVAAAEQAEKDQAEVAYYSDLLRNLTAQNWNRPPSARNNMVAIVQLTLSPFGDLLEVRLLEGSGNEAYDRSVIQALKQAAPFPELRGLERRVFNERFKRINFKFRPEDLVR